MLCLGILASLVNIRVLARRGGELGESSREDLGSEMERVEEGVSGAGARRWREKRGLVNSAIVRSKTVLISK